MQGSLSDLIGITTPDKVTRVDFAEVDARVDIKPGITKADFAAAPTLDDLLDHTKLEEFAKKLETLARARAEEEIAQKHYPLALDIVRFAAHDAQAIHMAIVDSNYTTGDSTFITPGTGIRLYRGNDKIAYIMPIAEGIDRGQNTNAPQANQANQIVEQITNQAAEETFPALIAEMDRKLEQAQSANRDKGARRP